MSSKSVIRYLYFGLWLISIQALGAQSYSVGSPIFENYSPELYKAHSQNNATVMDSRGIIYVANRLGLLEFDGTDWNLIKLKGDLEIGSLALGKDKKVYVGAKSEMGYLSSDSLGRLAYQSLNEVLPENYRSYAEIENILESPWGLAFQSAQEVFFYQNGQFEIERSQHSYDRMFLINGNLYVREWDTGLMKYDGQEFKLLRGGEAYASDRIMTIFEDQEGRLVIGSRNLGLHYFESRPKDLKEHSWGSPMLRDFLLEYQLSTSLRISEDEIVIASSQNGLILVNKQGDILKYLNRKRGLQSNLVRHLYLDAHHNLWLALDIGVSRVEIKSAFTLYNEYLGLNGRILNSTLHQGKLYIGTSQGIFYKNWSEETNGHQGKMEFQAVANSKGYVGVFQKFQDELVYSHTEGVLTVKDSVAQVLIANEAAIAFSTLRNYPDYLLVAKVSGGLSVLRKIEDSWSFYGDVQGLNGEINFLVEDKEGYIWFSDFEKGLARFKLNQSLDKSIDFQQFDERHGLPAYSRNSIFCLNDELVFITRAGAMRFDEEKQFFVPYVTINRSLFSPTYVNPLIADKNKNIWFIQYGNVGYINLNQNQKLPPISIFNRLNGDVLNHITPIDSKNILFGTRRGLYHYRAQNQTPTKPDFRALIRRVVVQNPQNVDSLIFAGNHLDASLNRVGFDNEAVVLDYAYNDIRFRYSAPWYIERESLRFSYFLEGLDQEWTEGLLVSEKAYSNLAEGEYTFHVKATNIYGQESGQVSFKFTVLPPWYRTYSAYFFYLLGLALLVLILIRLNSLRYRRRNKYLESEIDKGLASIKEKNQQLEVQNKKIERSYEDIKLMGEIGQAITANLSVEAIIQTLYSRINKLMDVTVFGIGLIDPQNNTLLFHNSRENGDTLPDFRFEIEDESRLATWCFREQKDIFLSDFPNEYAKYLESYPGPFTGQASLSIIYVPLYLKGLGIGVITVQSYAKNAYQPYHLNILKNLAVHVSIALENAKSYEQLSALNAEKNHLISIVAHDLRNPLHNIYGMADVIKLNAENLNPKQAQYLDRILDSTSRINQMIGQILDMNAIESNQININFESIDLRKVLHKARENFLHQARDKSIEILYQRVEKDCYARVDRNYTLQVLENLISNALKFSPVAKEIHLGLFKREDKVLVMVRDFGPGIPPDEMPKLFGKFQKLSTKPTAGEYTTGLGLSIVKKYVEAMDGEVWCENQAGGGTAFYLSFPLLPLKSNPQEKKVKKE